MYTKRTIKNYSFFGMNTYISRFINLYKYLPYLLNKKRLLQACIASNLILIIFSTHVVSNYYSNFNISVWTMFGGSFVLSIMSLYLLSWFDNPERNDNFFPQDKVIFDLLGHSIYSTIADVSEWNHLQEKYALEYRLPQILDSLDNGEQILYGKDANNHTVQCKISSVINHGQKHIIVDVLPLDTIQMYRNLLRQDNLSLLWKKEHIHGKHTQNMHMIAKHNDFSLWIDMPHLQSTDYMHLGTAVVDKKGILQEQNEIFNKWFNNTMEWEIILRDNPNTFMLHTDDGTAIKCWVTERSADLREILCVNIANDTIHIGEHSQKIQMIGQLTSGIVHDFNNLLTAIIGFSDLLLISQHNTQNDIVNIMHIKQNANRAVELTSKLLSFIKKQEIHLKAENLSEITLGMKELLTRLIGERITLTLNCAPDLWKTNINAGQIEQILINLAVNARDAMYNYTGTLSISTCNTTIDITKDKICLLHNNYLPSGTYVKLSVEDNGCGISEDDIDKLCNPFFSTKENGTGLGLSTVYNILEQSGGYIAIHSTLDVGCTINIYLPQYNNNLTEEDGNEMHERKTILLVEDEMAVMICTEAVLKNNGYNVISVGCAKKALDIMQSKGQEINLIITDVIMPDLNGPELMQQINSMGYTTQAIFISGYSELDIKQWTKYDLCHEIMSKPFTLDQLTSKVTKVLSKEDACEGI